MKKTITLLFVVTISIIANATTRRVGFTATSAVAGVDYATLQMAHDSANTGDTIQIYPTIPSTSYSCTVNKKLVMIGTGYFTSGGYNANAGYQYMPGACSIYSFTLDAGSSGSTFLGLGTAIMVDWGVTSGDGARFQSVSGASIDNITIKRCNINYIELPKNAIANNWLISQCYFIGNAVNVPQNCTATSLRIENCISNSTLLDITSLANWSLCTGTILNNTVAGGGGTLNLYNAAFLVKDNIFYNSFAIDKATNSVFQNNITLNGPSSNPMNTAGSSGNVFGVPFTFGSTDSIQNNNLFFGWPYFKERNSPQRLYSEDYKFSVRSGSVAKTASSTGGEVGAFGGANPYRIAGIPATPAFYQLSAPGGNTVSGNTLNINFSVRSNN